MTGLKMRKSLSLPNRLTVMGRPALLRGEGENKRHELMLAVSDAVKPADVIDKIMLEEFVTLALEVDRLRRLKVELMNSTVDRGLARLLLPLLHGGAGAEFVPAAERSSYSALEARDWADRYLAGDLVAINKVDELLKVAGLARDDAIMAHTANLAMKHKKRIEFKDAWFDPTSDEAPETDPQIVGQNA